MIGVESEFIKKCIRCGCTIFAAAIFVESTSLCLRCLEHEHSPHLPENNPAYNPYVIGTDVGVAMYADSTSAHVAYAPVPRPDSEDLWLKNFLTNNFKDLN